MSAALRRAGRQRGNAAASVRLQAIFRRTWLHQLPTVEAAMGRQALALLKQLEAAARAADDLAEATRLVFQQHPQRAIFTSFPGLRELPAARLLAEIGDDSTRFADARGLKAYAGVAPFTRPSGEKLVVLHRKVKNHRLAAVGYLGAVTALRLPGQSTTLVNLSTARVRGAEVTLVTWRAHAHEASADWPGVAGKPGGGDAYAGNGATGD